MLPSLIALVLGLPHRPPAALQPFQLRPAVVLDAEPEFEESKDVESETEPRPVVPERPAPARKVAPRAARKAKAPLPSKRSGRP